jgi:hypothetical protein
MKYQVWMEGFLVTGMEGIPAQASLVGEADADSFQEACNIVCGWMPDYDGSRVWGCRLFDNRIDAQKTFG